LRSRPTLSAVHGQRQRSRHLKDRHESILETLRADISATEKQAPARNGILIKNATALAQADLGIAIGAGTGVAIETAQIVLMRSDPVDVLAAIRLSQATVVKIRQNLFWAAIYNVIAIPIAAGVLYPLGILLSPAVAALAMSASSITVATNAILLKRVEPRLRAAEQMRGPTTGMAQDEATAPAQTA
jgi:hypothetical protein